MIYILMYKNNRVVLNTHEVNDLLMLCALRRSSDCRVLNTISEQGEFYAPSK